MKKPVFIFLTLCCLQACKENTDMNVKDKFINDMMSKMTLDEKLGQLNLPDWGSVTTGTAQSANVTDKIKQGHVGALFNIKGLENVREVQRIAVEFAGHSARWSTLHAIRVGEELRKEAEKIHT